MGKTFRIVVNGIPYAVEVGDLSAFPVEVKVDGQVFRVEVEREAAAAAVPVADGPCLASPPPSPAIAATPRPEPASVPSAAPAAPAAVSGKTIAAPMPGVVLAVKVKDGDRVHRGQEVCLLESMKMELSIMAAADGVVKKVCAAVGQSVVHGTVLIELE